MSLKILIIGLSRVGLPPPESHRDDLFISRKLLVFQLTLLQKIGFRFTTLRDAVNKKAGKFAVITFDGGNDDILTEALPVLRKFLAPATVFVITEDVGKKQAVWQETSEKLLTDLLSWEDLKFLRREGWEVGSHSHSRVSLSGLSNADQEESILVSIEEIRRQLGVEPVSFSYPFGNFQPATKKILKGCGIKYAVTTRQSKSLNFDESTDLLELPRILLGGRKARHYFKSLIGITKTIGTIPALQGLIKIWLMQVQSIILRSIFISRKQEKHP